MRKEKGWTQQQYERCYRNIRKFPESLTVPWMKDITMEIGRAADYSYQGAQHNVIGWMNTRRCTRFHEIKYRILTHRGELPY